jgi:hypothetical protein
MWGVIASFMPDDGEGEGLYRLAQVQKGMLKPSVLAKARRRVLGRLFDLFKTNYILTYRLENYSRLFPSDTVYDRIFGSGEDTPPVLPPPDECQLIVEVKSVMDVVKRKAWTLDKSNVNLALCLWAPTEFIDPGSLDTVDHSVSLDPALSVVEYYERDQQRQKDVYWVVERRLNEWELLFSSEQRLVQEETISEFRERVQSYARHFIHKRFPNISQLSHAQAKDQTLGRLTTTLKDPACIMEQYLRFGRYPHRMLGGSCAPPFPP